jgi:hypothetical protein
MRECPLAAMRLPSLISLAVLLTACGGDPLDYQTAMDLLRERTTDPLRISFSASPQLDSGPAEVTQAYQRLIDDHVIQCKTSRDVATLCEPGPAGDALTQDGVSELSFVAGRWVPDSIVSIRRTGRDSAVADVRMTFQPSPIFHDYEAVFNQIQSASRAMEFDTGRKQGKLVHVTFQRYAEGWHVESVE